MTLEQLNVFLAVAERQHLTKAAAALRMSPSTVSASIRALEARHGIELFNRVGRGIALTAAGRSFLPVARAVVTQARDAQATLAELCSVGRGTVSVHASQTIANYWLPGRLMLFRRQYPHVEIDLSIGNTSTVTEAVKEGQAELGFVEGAINESRVTAARIASDRLVIVVAAELRDTPLEGIASMDWIMREAGSGTRMMFEDSLAEAGIDPRQLRVAMTLPSNEAVLTAVRSGAYATAMSEVVVAPFLSRGDLSILDLALRPRAFFLVRHRERPLSAAARALERMCRPDAP